MKTAARWRAGSASDPGLLRTINEDRVWFDDARGIFLVVDGLGGHAAGEVAAATAVEVVRQNLEPASSDLESHIRAVICAANNEIYRRSEENPSWYGMACVLTLAVVQDDHIVIGHVGDSRLYLLWNGTLSKITSDHSPVGEQEDQGLLSEAQAMNHPRRNEVFRDVGSAPRLSDDKLFIETRRMLFRDDAALMLCSDGLTDCVTAAEITAILEQFDGNPERSAQLLVEAANAAGGKDNISVVFVAGAEFTGADSKRSQDARSRHATTRQRSDTPAAKSNWEKYLLVALLSVALGLGLWQIVIRVTSVPAAPASGKTAGHTVEVSASDARGIIDALNLAVPGETILVPPGEFLGPLILKEGVNITAKVPRQSILHCDPAATAEPGTGIVARGLRNATVTGLRISSDDTHPLKTGILLIDSSPALLNLDVSGAVYSGIRMEGDSAPHIIDCFIHANGGAGIGIGDRSTPALVRNQIMQNGLMVNSARPGVEVGPEARPVMEGNLISGNGAAEPLKTKHQGDR